MIGRPQSTEAAPYSFTYIDQVAGEDPLALLEGQLDESLAFLSDISEERSLYRYAPGKWTIHHGVEGDVLEIVPLRILDCIGRSLVGRRVHVM